MDRLVEALEERRGQTGLSAKAFAERIGVSESTYSRVRNGLLPAGRRFLRGSIRAYPELAVILALDSRDAELEVAEGVA